MPDAEVTSRPAQDGEVPIVLLHGATSSARIWEPLLPALSPRHRVVVPTLAGHRGGSPMPTGGGTAVERIVDDVCRQLDEAHIPSAHLVGNSLGGWVALELARRGRASSVLALSPAGGWTHAVDLQRMLLIFHVARLLRRSKTMPRIAVDPQRRRMLLRATTEHADRLTTTQTAAIFEDMAECDVLVELIRGARESGPIKSLSAPCPIRIVWGALDRTLPFARYGRPMIAALPGAELEVLPGVGHVPMIDDPEATVDAILRFIEDVAPQQKSLAH